MIVTGNFWPVLGLATSILLCQPLDGRTFVCGFVPRVTVTTSASSNTKSRYVQACRTTPIGNTRLCASTGMDDSSMSTTPPALSSVEGLKKNLLQLGASYDRGYGATKRANTRADSLIEQLEALNPEAEASRGVEGNTNTESSPLAGSWRMVWTTAADVLTLSANPLVTVGAIYQVFDLPKVTNIIDLLPPFQTLVGSTALGSVLRAKVTTRAYRPTDAATARANPNRIGLEFETVALQPMELLGNSVEGVLPPLAVDLPKSPFEGFFDVTFVDGDLLIVRQNAPGGLGGLFVLSKVDNVDP